LQSGQGDLGLELRPVQLGFLAHLRSSFKSLIHSLPNCPNTAGHRRHTG
jgi:hypothetical protein